STTCTCPSSTRATTMWKLLDPRSTAATTRAGAGTPAVCHSDVERSRRIHEDFVFGTHTARVARKKILVVDDEKDLVDIVAFNLRREQYDVLPARCVER